MRQYQTVPDEKLNIDQNRPKNRPRGTCTYLFSSIAMVCADSTAFTALNVPTYLAYLHDFCFPTP